MNWYRFTCTPESLAIRFDQALRTFLLHCGFELRQDGDALIVRMTRQQREGLIALGYQTIVTSELLDEPGL